MENTSLGYHTFSIFRKLSKEEYKALCKDFAEYVKSNKDSKGYRDNSVQATTWEYSYNKNKGIRWRLSCKAEFNGYILRKIEAIINPQALLNNNYITAATEHDLYSVEPIFDEEADKISPHLLTFKDYSLNRADYCMNVDIKELGYHCTPQQVMKLIKQGDIPEFFKERSAYSDTGHRFVADKNSFYLENSSITINYYLKYPQQTDSHPNFENRDASENVIRLEVQCKRKKLSEIMSTASMPIWQDRTDSANGSIPIFPMLSDKISEYVVREYFNKVIRKGHYFTYDGAYDIIKSYRFKRNKEERLLDAIDLVKECDGIANAKKHITCNKSKDEADIAIRNFNKALRELDDLLINPVTIPRRWNMTWIPNLMWAYCYSVYDEVILYHTENRAMQHIKKYLFKRDN